MNIIVPATRSILASLSLMQMHPATFVPDMHFGAARVGSSGICYGRGLFANEHLPKHCLVSMYPVHAIGVDQADGCVELLASTSDMEHFDAVQQHEYRAYLRHAGMSKMCIDFNPNRPIVPGWAACLANDADLCKSREPSAVESYLERSIGGANCALVPIVGCPPMMACVTLRDVAADEELLLSYGPSYWVGGKPLDGASCSSERRQSGSAVVDADYWGRRGGERTRELLDQSSAAVLAATSGLSPATVTHLTKGLEAALDVVWELEQAEQQQQQQQPRQLQPFL